MTVDPQSRVSDEEVLYRSVPIGRNRFMVQPDGSFVPSSQAFTDIAKQISVDRSILLNNDPKLAMFRETDGILWFKALEARQITVTKVEKMPGHPKTETLLVADVIADPKPEEDPPRPAHAYVALTPELGNGSNFRKLMERLARLTQTGRWAILPDLSERE